MPLKTFMTNVLQELCDLVLIFTGYRDALESVKFKLGHKKARLITMDDLDVRRIDEIRPILANVLFILLGCLNQGQRYKLFVKRP